MFLGMSKKWELKKGLISLCCRVGWFMMLSAAFNNNYVIAWWSVLLVEKKGIEKGFNAVFQFNAKKGTIGYVLDCSLRYISYA
jgi:hypothetical protein